MPLTLRDKSERELTAATDTSLAMSLAQRMPRWPAPTVAEISSQLYAAYTVDGGTMQLAGCTLQPEPIVHATGRGLLSASGQVVEQPIEVFLSGDGQQLDAATIADLGLRNLIAADKPPRLMDAEVERLVNLGRAAVESRCKELGGALLSNDNMPTGVDIEIVWCRWAAGKLRFTLGQQFIELPFSDWAMRLTPPAFVCPYSGRMTFHLAATEDGRIVAAEEIAVCEQTGRRMLRGELVTCSATNKHVSPELVETCPVTQQPVLRDAMVACPTCRIRVSPKAIGGERCLACSKLQPVKRGDPRLMSVLERYPGLNGWRRWQLAETPEAYVIEARGLVRRLLVVVDKQSLEITRWATRRALEKSWSDVSPLHIDKL